MEMNTRLQVEHPVTEMVTGLDLVEWQVRVAAGEPLSRPPGRHRADRPRRSRPGSTPRIRRAASCPTGGDVLAVRRADGDGVRVDSGLRAGTVVGSDYDPMLAKVIAHGADRAEALRRLDRALAETAVLGVVTNVDFLRFLLADPDVVAGVLDTGLLDRRVGDYAAPTAGDDDFARRGRPPVADPLAEHDRYAPSTRGRCPRGWRVGEHAPPRCRGCGRGAAPTTSGSSAPRRRPP